MNNLKTGPGIFEFFESENVVTYPSIRPGKNGTSFSVTLDSAWFTAPFYKERLQQEALIKINEQLQSKESNSTF